MLRLSKRILSIGLIATLILIPFGSSVMAEENKTMGSEITTAGMAADLLLVRPVGILAMSFGGAVFIIGSPFSASGGNIESTYEKLVVSPAKYTFKRPLGDI